jgi:thiamine-monophosphate kinase
MMPSKPFKISDIGEKKIIKRLLSRSRQFQLNSPFFDELYSKSQSDDAALIDFKDKYLVATSDLLIESSHFPPEMTHFQRGMKVVTVNVSDLSAMGAQPIGFILSMGLPNNLRLSEFDEILEGVLRSCQDYKMNLIGGDTNKAEEIILSGTSLGVVDKEKVLMKAGARPGDVLAVTGQLGLAAAGFEVLMEGQSLRERINPRTQELVIRYALQPHARLNTGFSLAETGAVTAATDITDGLASEIGELMDASGEKVGITIYEDKIPIAPEVKEIAAEINKNPLELAIYYGEDFELLLTVKKTEFDSLKDEYELIEVGVVTNSGKMEIVDKDGKTNILKPLGFQHFNKP